MAIRFRYGGALYPTKLVDGILHIIFCKDYEIQIPMRNICMGHDFLIDHRFDWGNNCLMLESADGYMLTAYLSGGIDISMKTGTGRWRSLASAMFDVNKIVEDNFDVIRKGLIKSTDKYYVTRTDLHPLYLYVPKTKQDIVITDIDDELENFVLDYDNYYDFIMDISMGGDLFPTYKRTANQLQRMGGSYCVANAHVIIDRPSDYTYIL